jgi:glyoxylase-like metal-dependent hydrolase (beta-lactamase superfamily II)
MLHVAKFTFNPFQENTYVIHGRSEAIIMDPGCYDHEERQELAGYLESNALKPVRLVLTHAHIDHILGNAWIYDRYRLKPELHQSDEFILSNGPQVARLYGLHYEASPDAGKYWKEGDRIKLEEDDLEVIHVPGHSPGHIALFQKDQRFVVQGDVLFQGSIGRTDLPGGDYETLLQSIRTKLFVLGDDVKVYSGHGPETTIGAEKRSNPFLRSS